MNTLDDILEEYMALSDNDLQVGYAKLKLAIRRAWYQLFKKTRESLVRRWVPVKNGKAEFPKYAETVLGVMNVNSCGDLAPLYEDNIKSDLPKPPSKIKCNVCCDENTCSFTDSETQRTILVNGVERTEKTITRVLKNGQVVVYKETPVAKVGTNGTVTGFEVVKTQETKCKLETLPCGCVPETTGNVEKICGCAIECAPYLRDKQTAIFNEYGYYKLDYGCRSISIYDMNGKPAADGELLVVYESNGMDMLVPDYAFSALTALVDWIRKQYSPMYNDKERASAKQHFKSEKMGMLMHLNPIPWPVVEVHSSEVGNQRHGMQGHGYGSQPAPQQVVHQTVIQQVVSTVPAVTPTQKRRQRYFRVTGDQLVNGITWVPAIGSDIESPYGFDLIVFYNGINRELVEGSEYTRNLDGGFTITTGSIFGPDDRFTITPNW